MPIILIFIILPLLELAVFGAVSEHIGVWTALLFALLTAIIGGNLVRMQGLQTIASMRGSMDKGQMPLNEIFDGFCLVAAGALLITPGFLTDAIGFALLVPPVRAGLRHVIQTHTNWSVDIHGDARSHMKHDDDDVIDGEYETINDEQIDDKNAR